jgi:glycosyltransferase involved in cell wall biosynthesis
LTVRPRLLFLCQTLPYPPDGGVWIRTYHVLRLLARAFDITALCFERSASSGSPAGDSVAASRAALGRFADVEVFPIPQRNSRVRYLWDHFRSTALRRAYTAYLYDSGAYRRRLIDVLKSKAFDLVHMDSLDLFRYLPVCDALPVICVHHDVESARLQRRAAIERHAWRRTYVRYQARLMEDVERRWCERVALNVTVSESDRARLKRIAPAARVAIVPNGVDTEEFQPHGPHGTGVAYVGGIHWFPNLDALEFFSGDILPHLRAAKVDVATRWIGSASTEQQQHYRERHGIEVTGYVEDVRPFMREAACHIVPLRAGGGTRLKILNSWAMAKAVVSTSIGCEGLEAVDGENILIRDDPKDFARAILAVLDDHELRRRLGERGRASAERFYSWDVIGQAMIGFYRDVANARSRDVPSAIPTVPGQQRYGPPSISGSATR